QSTHSTLTARCLDRLVRLDTPTHHPDPPSFPTRRSSDLSRAGSSKCGTSWAAGPPSPRARYSSSRLERKSSRPTFGNQRRPRGRSEEHTSELQSRVDLVCRLLLEKKKTSRVRSKRCRVYT